MGFYDKYCLPHLIDLACGLNAVHRQRAKIVPKAHGKVLEVGIGTGLNLPHYRPELINELWGLDPGTQMHRLAEKRMRQSGLDVRLMGLKAEQIPMEDASFDTVVCTYTLCTIVEPVQALREMARVLKPGGRLLFCEHGRAPDEPVRRWQDRLDPCWGSLAGGCHLNRPIPDLLCQAGWTIEQLESMYLPGPRPMTYNYWGEARCAASG